MNFDFAEDIYNVGEKAVKNTKDTIFGEGGPSDKRSGGGDKIPAWFSGVAKEYAEGEKTKSAGLKLRDELESLAEKSQSKEDELRGMLTRETGEATGAVDKLLSSLIDQTGYTAGLSKQAIGAGMSERGILRSGQTAEKLENVDIAKAGDVTSLTAQRNAQIRKMQDVQNKAFKQVEDRRTEIEFQLKAAEQSAVQSLEYKEQAMKIQMDMKQFINDLELSSLATQDLTSMLGSLATLAGVGAGYYYGGTSEPSGGTAEYMTNKRPEVLV